MADKKIITIWDEHKLLKENIHFLKTKTKTVTFPASDFIKTIVQDLIDAYQIINCAGIAANQIGYEYQIFIGMKELIDPEDAEAIEKAEAELSDAIGNPHGDNYEIYINPRIDKITKTLATIIVPSLIFKLSPKKRPNAMNAANNPKP